MDVFLLHNVSQEGDVRVDEQADDDAKLLGCNSTDHLAYERGYPAAR